MKTSELAIIGIVLLAAIYFGASFILTQPQPIKFGDDSSAVLYFERDSCYWCQQQRPIMNALADEGFRVKVMDVEKNPDYWTQYSLQGTPTLIDSKTGERREGFLGAVYDGGTYNPDKSRANETTQLREWLTAHGAKIK